MRWLTAIVFLVLGHAASAALVEEQHDLPVEVTDAYGKVIAQPIRLTVFVDDATPAPRPVLVINHGRSSEAAERAGLGRVRFNVTSGWFAALGFAVVVPTRIGYGVSGGEDVEDTGSCAKKNYPPGYAAAARQTIAALAWMHARPDTQKDRDVVLGQSYGGATSIALAAMNLPGLVAAINFAGGGGGNPKTQPQAPCAPVKLQRLFADYGKTARVPTLWIYAENDMYFGPVLPREWFHAFEHEGGVGRFIQLPPQGDDGHLTFTRSQSVWKPLVLDFLRARGFKV